MEHPIPPGAAGHRSIRAHRLFILAWLALVPATTGVAADQIPLCCGRGEPLLGKRPATPLELRVSPWSGDLILAFQSGSGGSSRENLEHSIGELPGIQRVETDPEGRFLRIWLHPGPLPMDLLCRELAARGTPVHATEMTPLRFDRAGEKGRLQSVEGTLRRAPGIVSFEVEVEGEEAVARIWHMPGADLAGVVTVLESAGIRTWLPTLESATLEITPRLSIGG